jgi:hypothetical protein
MTSQQKRQIKQALFNGDIQKANAILDTIDTSPTRSLQQNSALHVYLTLVADELDKRGFTMQDVVKAIRRAEIRPTKEAMKSVVWKPLQFAIYRKESTTKLKKSEVDRVYETMNKWLGKEFDGIHVPWPSRENKPTTLANIEAAKKLPDYPEYEGEPTI